ncbi:hypothetical protein GGI11_003868, partial [Coemansia sp. RSA 2049]
LSRWSPSMMLLLQTMCWRRSSRSVLATPLRRTLVLSLLLMCLYMRQSTVRLCMMSENVLSRPAKRFLCIRQRTLRH